MSQATTTERVITSNTHRVCLWFFPRQFGVGSLLLLVTIAAVLAATLTQPIRGHWRDGEVVAALAERVDMAGYSSDPPSWLPAPLRRPFVTRLTSLKLVLGDDSLDRQSTPSAAVQPDSSEVDRFNCVEMAQIAQQLARLDKLVDLAVTSETLTNEGLRPLSSLTQLRYLELRCPNVTESGIERLQQALPELQINDD